MAATVPAASARARGRSRLVKRFMDTLLESEAGPKRDPGNAGCCCPCIWPHRPFGWDPMFEGLCVGNVRHFDGTPIALGTLRLFAAPTRDSACDGEPREDQRDARRLRDGREDDILMVGALEHLDRAGRRPTKLPEPGRCERQRPA